MTATRSQRRSIRPRRMAASSRTASTSTRAIAAAIELAMSDEEIGSLTALSRSRTEPAQRVERARMLLAYRDNPSFFAVGRRLGVHHQTVERCVQRALAYGPLTASMTDRIRERSRRSRRRPRLGWYLWRATRPKSTAIHMSCGRSGFLAPMRASMDRRLGTNVSPGWCRARCARYWAKRKSIRTRCATTWNVATPSSSRRWCRSCVYREVQILKETAAKSKKPGNGWRSSPTTRNRESKPSQRRRRTCRPYLVSTRPSRAIMSINAMARSACWPDRSAHRQGACAGQRPPS